MRSVRPGLRWLGAALAFFVLHADVSRGEEAPELHQTQTGPPLACLRNAEGQPQATPQMTQSAAPEETTRDAGSPPTAAGMRIFLDPQTGQRVSPDQLPAQALSAREQAMMRRDDNGLTQRTLPNGAVVADLEGRFHSFAVARIGPEGGVVKTHCVTDSEAKRSLLEAPVDPPAGPRAPHGD